MFSERKVLEKLARFKERYGWMPVEHSLEEVDKVNAYFKTLYTRDESGEEVFDDSQWTPKLKRWVENERAMCNPPEAPVWMADYTFKTIGDIKPGDEIIGWERQLRPTVKRYRNAKPMNLERLVKTRVVAVARRISPIVKLTMESGRVIRCTPDHLWSCGASYRNQNPWQTPKVGRVLRRVVDLYANEPPDVRTAAWLGGIYDGEGSGNYITQSSHANPELCEVIARSLEKLNFAYSSYKANDEGKTGRERRAVNFQILGGRDGLARFAAWCKPSKRRSIDPKILSSMAAAPDRIAKIEDDGEGEVVSMQTETGNYVVWGYASKNCAISCAYFLTRYYYISADNRIFRFAFRSGQRVFFRVLQELEDRGASIELQCLKARQQGISTLVEGIMTWFALFLSGSRCSIGSANDQKTYVMMGMMYTALEHIPWWLPPTQTKDKRSGAALLEFAHVGTQIVVQSGSIKGGIGQGTTSTKIHLSEVCDFTDPVMQIEEGLFKQVHSSPEIFMVLESTGNGNTGWWADQWRRNKEKYWDGRARLLPLFLPWYMTPELYPTATWIKQFPIKAGWTPSASTRAMTAKCEAYAHSTQVISRILGKDWRLPPEQQWFWEFNYEDAKERRTDKSWLRQMPCDDFEALIGENDSVFDWQTVVNIQTRRERSIEAYGMLGADMAEKHDPPPAEVSDEPRILIPWKTPGEVRLEWVLMPLKGDPEASNFDPLKKLLIYEHPLKAAMYSIGVDPGSGVGGDRTAITVTKTGRDAHADRQVAEFASDDISNVEVYAWVAAIAAYYGQYMEDETPRIIIEQRRKYGDSCYHALKLHGFRNHHKFREYDKKTLRPKQHDNGREGWFTNAWSRPLLLGMFKYAVDGGWFEVNSKWLLAEIEGFEQRTTEQGATRMDHMQGKHDDRIFAAAMSYFTLHDLDVMAERAKKRYNADEDEPLEVDLSPWHPVVQNKAAEEFFEAFEGTG
jgi:hypothetical protein